MDPSDALFVIDASGWIYRSYFAIPHMTNVKGESTNALYGFIRTLLKLLKDFSPKKLVIVFDGPRNIEKRKVLYPHYKAQRSKMPLDLLEQIHRALEFCDLFGLPKLAIEGVEADDTMGSLAIFGKEQGWRVFLCSSDKDLAQLVNSSVFLLNTHKENLILGEKEIEELYGVPPAKMVDYLAITGDSSDNIPGIAGFGPKTAKDLLQKFSSLENLIQNVDKISGEKKQETIKQNEKLALLSKQLVTIDTHVPVPEDPSFYQKKDINLEGIKEFYKDMQFLSLLKELGEDDQEKEEIQTSYVLVQDENTLQEMLRELSKEKEICFSTQATNAHPLEAKLLGIGFGVKPGKAWYIPFNGSLKEHFLKEILSPFFQNPSLLFFGHNSKYDCHILENEGFRIPKIGFDTVSASYLLNAHQRKHALDLLFLEYFGKKKLLIESLLGKGKLSIGLDEVPFEKISFYSSEEIDYTIRLKHILEKKLKERNLTSLLEKIDLPLLPVLQKMERNGIFIDQDMLLSLSKTLRKEIDRLSEEIFSLAGQKFNLNSPKQLGEILYQKLGIKPLKKTATGLSTNAEVLENLSKDFPIAAKLLEYRTLEKLRSTYIEALPLSILKETGRVHCTFNQSLTTTGRLSCQDPNLQNIPIRAEIGREIRQAFRPQKEGWSYISADYSQMELRLLAHFSEDPTLIEAFTLEKDVHAYTAKTLWNISIEDVTFAQRHQAKAVNFGMMYGQQAFGLAKELGIEPKEAASFIEAYFLRYKNVKKFLEECKQKALDTGKATTYFGRERLLPEIQNKNMMIRNAALRLAINTPIQGTAADMIKLAMIRIQERIEKEKRKGFMVLQIHDELLFEVPDDEIESFTKMIKDEMENVIHLKVPMSVDIAIGKNWKEC